MSGRGLWLLSAPLALLGWAGVVFLTAALPVSATAMIVIAPALALALTATVAPWVWIIARRLRLPAIGRRPVAAFRVAAWFGLWVTLCVGLRILHAFSWLAAMTLLVVFGLLEAFFQQSARN
jgi:hypothetical protein